MQFYTKQHKFYCGIDLHTKKMYVCILDEKGEIREHRNMNTNPESFLAAVAPFREDIVVAVECMFTWYWLADLCQKEGIPFVLGHALYMKAIHGGKAKNDKIDSQEDRRSPARRHDPHVLCVPGEDAGDQGSHEEEESSREKTSRTAGPYPEYQQSV